MEIAILGAGCSGSSLVYHLVRGGFAGEIHVLDGRTEFSREQRWCSWGPIPNPLAGLVDASWPRWKVLSGRKEARCSLPQRPYLHVHAPRFYRHVHAELIRTPNVHLHFGTTFHSIEESGKRLLAETSKGTLAADMVFDSRPSQEDQASPGADTHVRLRQSFAGLVVRSDEAAFDPRTATLMDFGIDEPPGLSFVYVLPFSADRALVESTAFSRGAVPALEHRRRVERYLERQGVSGYCVESEESGNLPMSTESYPTHKSDRHLMIGVAGGATRPSSGYAFVQLLRQGQRIARAMVRGQIPPVSEAIPRKQKLFDAIFLDAVDRSPALARSSFVRMFERVPPAALIRFLSNESCLRDEMRLIAALPKTPFVRAALRRAVSPIR
jgi:lycopene beta-cyclase